MGKRFYKIIVVSFFLFLNLGFAHGQEQPKQSTPGMISIMKSARPAFIRRTSLHLPVRPLAAPVMRQVPRPAPQFLPPPDIYTRQFGFFCRQELQFEKTTRIPLRFRLCSLAHSNALEGK